MIDHPCSQCEAQAYDRAIICPALGVMSANRCKRIKAHDTESAFDMLYGLRRGAHNNKKEIKVKRPGIDKGTATWRTTRMLQGGISYLTLSKPKRRPARTVGLTSDSLASGAGGHNGRGTEDTGLPLAASGSENWRLAPELQA